MFNATSLLGGMLQQIATPSARQRMGAALGRMTQGGVGGPLGGLLSQFNGGAGGGVLGNVLGALRGSGRDPQADRDYVVGLARQAVTSPRQEVANNNPLAVGGLGALVGTLLGGGRGAVGGGLLAVLGSLAVSALRDSKQAPTAALAALAAPGAPEAPGAPTGGSGGYGRPVPDSPEEVERMSRLVLRAMIQAAKADGKIEPGEIERITGMLDDGDPEGGREARDFVLAEMGGPADPASLAREVRSPVEAAEVYAAALMAIEVDSDAERDFLAHLARELGLRPETVAELHGSVGLKEPMARMPPPV